MHSPSQTPLILIDYSPIPEPQAPRLQDLLQLLATGGRAVETYYGQRYVLRLYHARGRAIWTGPAWAGPWRAAWEQARRNRWVTRCFWIGSRAEYALSETGRQALAELRDEFSLTSELCDTAPKDVYNGTESEP